MSVLTIKDFQVVRDKTLVNSKFELGSGTYGKVFLMKFIQD
jgi:hypothetical protein